LIIAQYIMAATWGQLVSNHITIATSRLEIKLRKETPFDTSSRYLPKSFYLQQKTFGFASENGIMQLMAGLD